MGKQARTKARLPQSNISTVVEKQASKWAISISG